MKVGGHVFLQHIENEAERENYYGVHQWNFSEKSGRALLWGVHGCFDLSSHFRDVADVTTERHEISVNIILRKKADSMRRRRLIAARINKEAHQLLPLWRWTRRFLTTASVA